MISLRDVDSMYLLFPILPSFWLPIALPRPQLIELMAATASWGGHISLE